MTLSEVSPTAIRALPAAPRQIIRVDPADKSRLAELLGQPLPGKISTIVAHETGYTLCLGPDEWLVVFHSDAAPRIRPTTAPPCSIVDVGARDLAFELVGVCAAQALNSGCPADLDSMAPMTGARSVFDGIPIVLTKWSETTFRVDVGRSFAPHVLAILSQAVDELNCAGWQAQAHYLSG